MKKIRLEVADIKGLDDGVKNLMIQGYQVMKEYGSWNYYAFTLSKDHKLNVEFNDQLEDVYDCMLTKVIDQNQCTKEELENLLTDEERLEIIRDRFIGKYLLMYFEGHLIEMEIRD